MPRRILFLLAAAMVIFCGVASAGGPVMRPGADVRDEETTSWHGPFTVTGFRASSSTWSVTLSDDSTLNSGGARDQEVSLILQAAYVTGDGVYWYGTETRWSEVAIGQDPRDEEESQKQ